jgi:alginate O-acetyltransferase complex protein AlgI
MPFSNTDFLFLFLPVFLLAYVLLPARNALYLGFSLFFYFVGEGWYLGIVFVSMIANYGFGLMIDQAEERRRLAISLAVSANLASLFVFKYLGFVSVSLLGVAHDSRLATIHLPLGISFFTFHAISYLIDVYRRDVRAERSFVDLSLYMMMFPQLISGPILRFHLVAPQLRNRFVDGRKVYFGACLFCLGLAQKVLVADTLAGICDPLFSQWRTLSTASAWLAAVTYTLQIYFDFGGYSNMAIGLGWATGFFYPRNFDYPYISQSITEFWRRWHMSLSRWFRDYLYVPLGGNRHGPLKTYRNLVVVFLLCGVWHGASWTFVLWGIYHGALLVLERLGLGRLLERSAQPLRHLYAMLAVIFGWVLFRADGLKQIGHMMRLMVVPGPTRDIDVFYHLSHSEMATILLAALASTPLLARIVGRVAVLPSMPPWDEAHPVWAYWTGGLLALILFLAASIKVISGAYSPFIYFRF